MVDAYFIFYFICLNNKCENNKCENNKRENKCEWLMAY